MIVLLEIPQLLYSILLLAAGIIFFPLLFDSSGLVLEYKIWFIITFCKNSLLSKSVLFKQQNYIKDNRP